MKLHLSLIVSAGLLTCQNASAQDASSFDGTWGTSPKECSAPTDGYFQINKGRYTSNEFECNILSRNIVGSDLRLKLSCSGEGERWKQTVSYRKKGDTLTALPPSSPPVIYARCSPQNANDSSSPPKRMGECKPTKIQKIGYRLKDGDGHWIDDSGTVIETEDGGYQISYETIAAASESLIGDPVMVCVVSIERGCKMNTAGYTYTTINQRTGKSWKMDSSTKRCGG